MDRLIRFNANFVADLSGIGRDSVGQVNFCCSLAAIDRNDKTSDRDWMFHCFLKDEKVRADLGERKERSVVEFQSPRHVC